MKRATLFLCAALLAPAALLAQSDFWADEPHRDTAWAHSLTPGATNSIGTAGQLVQFAWLVNGGNSFAGTVNIITAPIDLSSYIWTPAGDGENPFLGTLTAEPGAVIRGMNIRDGNAYDNGYNFVNTAGLFGYLGADARVISLTLTNSLINVVANRDVFAGAIAGYNNRGMVSNCAVHATINAASDTTAASAYVHAGGIVGLNADIRAKVIGCEIRGEVNATLSANGNSYARAGGIAGANDGTVADCISRATAATFGKSSADAQAGGIVGYNWGITVNCENHSAATAVAAAAATALAGGIAGYNYRTVENCVSLGEVSGNGSIGAIAGYNNDTVANCYWDYAITHTLIRSVAVGGGVSATDSSAFTAATCRFVDTVTAGGLDTARLHAALNRYVATSPTIGQDVALSLWTIDSQSNSVPRLCKPGEPVVMNVALLDGSDGFLTVTNAFTFPVSLRPRSIIAQGDTDINGVTFMITNGTTLAEVFYPNAIMPHYVPLLSFVPLVPAVGVSSAWRISFNDSPPEFIFPISGVMPGTFTATDNIAGIRNPKITVKGLPPGMKYNAKTGEITGVPTKAGTFTITVTVKGADKASATQTFTLAIAPLPETAIGAFNGYLTDADGTVSGTFTLTAAKNGKLTAKVVMPTGSQSFSAKAWDVGFAGIFDTVLEKKKGATFSLTADTGIGVGALGVSGTFTSGDYNEFGEMAYSAVGQKTEAAPAAAYTVALPVSAITAEGTVQNAPLGDGYLTISVNAKGVAKLAGLAADGVTRLTGSVSMLHVGNDRVIPAVFKVNSDGGYLGGLLTVKPDGKIEGTDWHWLNPGKTPGEDNYTLDLAPFGSAYTTTDAAKYDGLTFKAVAPADPALWNDGAWWHMPSVAISEKNRQISLPKGKAPVKDRETGLYTFSATNPAVATLTLTKKSGVVKGKFNTYLSPDGGTTFTQTRVSWAGVLLPAHNCGTGSYLIPRTDNKKLKQSYRVVIE